MRVSGQVLMQTTKHSKRSKLILFVYLMQVYLHLRDKYLIVNDRIGGVLVAAHKESARRKEGDLQVLNK